MEDKSNILFIALITMIIIFSSVILWKGDFQWKESSKLAQQGKPTEEVSSVPQEKQEGIISKEFRGRAPAGGGLTPVIFKDDHYAVIDRRKSTKPIVSIEKDDAKRDVISNELIVIFNGGIPLLEVENIERKYALNLLLYDPALGIAQFSIPAGNRYKQKDLQRLIPAENPSIKTSQPNAIIELSALPNEIEHNALWHLKNDSRVRDSLGNLVIWRNNRPYSFGVQTTLNVDISWGRWDDSFHLWNSGHSCELANGRPIIGVVDTGSEPNHPGFPNRIDLSRSGNVNCPDNSISSFFDFDTHKDCYASPTELQQLYTDLKSWDPVKRQNSELQMGHGLMVSGIIVSNNDGAGALGVCPEGKILHMMMGKLTKVVDSQGQIQSIGHINTTIDGYLGIRKAIENGAKIINTSWHVNAAAQLCDGKYAGDCVILQAVRFARANGAMIIAAAGNQNRNIDNQAVSPASLAKEWDNPNNEFAHLISVGGISPQGKRWAESNYGTSVSLSVPSQIMAVPKFSDNYVTTAASFYGNVGPLDPNTLDQTKDNTNPYWMSGTSGATPIVSAVAAIIYRILNDRFGQLNGTNPHFIYDYPKAISKILLQHARQGGLCDIIVGQDSKFGCLDAQAAIDEASRVGALETLDVSSLPDGELLLTAGEAVLATNESDENGTESGCGFIDDTHHSRPFSGNWPIAIIYLMAICLIIRRSLSKPYSL